jgi:hypothetical protein
VAGVEVARQGGQGHAHHAPVADDEDRLPAVVVRDLLEDGPVALDDLLSALPAGDASSQVAAQPREEGRGEGVGIARGAGGVADAELAQARAHDHVDTETAGHDLAGLHGARHVAGPHAGDPFAGQRVGEPAGLVAPQRRQPAACVAEQLALVGGVAVPGHEEPSSTLVVTHRRGPPRRRRSPTRR